MVPSSNPSASTPRWRVHAALVAACAALGVVPACNCKKSNTHPQPSASTSASASAIASVSASASASGDEDLAEVDAGPAPDGGPAGGDPRFRDLPARTVVADGPHKIASKAMQAWVHQYPDDETPYLGYLRAGTVVDRSENAIIQTKRCKGGWYEVLPRGYLCAGKRATIDLSDPVVVASWKPAKRGEPLPFFYVRPADPPPFIYVTLPSMKEQLRTEGEGLKEHLATHPPAKLPNVDVLGTPEPIPEFLVPGKPLPTPFGATQRLRYRAVEGKANPQAAFALLSVHEHEGRLFGLTTDLDLLALDRTKIVKPPTTHGGPLDGLPGAMVLTHNTPRYKIGDDDKPHKDGEYTRRDILGLTGQKRGGLVETITGYWVPSGSLRFLEPRTSFPSFVTEGRKWIDVSIKNQMLIAYEGTKAVYAALVSTGLGEMSDPAKTFATVRGVFTIKSKHLTATMTGTAQADYELADVPYVQYFHESYALHAAFWHDDFGRVHSHGCINLPPVDAAWLFEWTDPQVPPNWHGANATTDQMGTVVNVHH